MTATDEIGTDRAIPTEQVEDGIDADGAARITESLALAKAFFAEVFADPSLLDEIPPGAGIVLVPAGDPASAAARERAAERMIAAGKSVHVHRLGQAGTKRPRRKA